MKGKSETWFGNLEPKEFFLCYLSSSPCWQNQWEPPILHPRTFHISSILRWPRSSIDLITAFWYRRWREEMKQKRNATWYARGYVSHWVGRGKSDGGTGRVMKMNKTKFVTSVAIQSNERDKYAPQNSPSIPRRLSPGVSSEEVTLHLYPHFLDFQGCTYSHRNSTAC